VSGPGFFCSLNGLPVVRGRIVFPAAGIWHADVEVAQPIAPPVGPQAIILNNVPYVCAAIRSVIFAGLLSVRLVGGTGGWRSTVPPMQYASPAGVPISVVLADAAAVAHEIPPVVDPTVSPILGPAYVRQVGPASLVLQQCLGNAWYMDQTGTVLTAPRIPTPIVTPFQAIAVDGAPGIYEIATDFPTDWTPGRLFASLIVQGLVSRTTYIISEGKFRVEVMAV
jgi:hypothetical protein